MNALPRIAAACCLALAAGCTGGGEWLPEYSHDEAAAQGLYPSAERWRLRAHPDARRTLGELLRWKEPAQVPIAGLGVVVGLDGTGDANAAIRPLLQFWRQGVQSGELTDVPPPERPGSAALVRVSSVMPMDGPPASAVVLPIGNATSLRGGRLVKTRLRAMGSADVMATVEGPLFLSHVKPDGSVERDELAGRVPNVVPVRRPDLRRLEFVLDDAIPGTEAAAVRELEQLLPQSKVWTEPGPPRTLFVALADGTPMPDLARLLARSVTIRVGEPGIVVIRGGGGRAEEVEVLGPPAALGEVHLRVSYGTEAQQDADGRYVRLIGVPRAQGRNVRKGLVEFETAGGRRVRVVTSNEFHELLPVLDRTGLPLRNLASALQQARDAGAIGAILRVDWGSKAQGTGPGGR